MHLVAQPHDGKSDRETETAGQQHHAPEIIHQEYGGGGGHGDVLGE